MLGRLIHFGPDDCHRLMVLRSAGYIVEDYRCLVQFRDSLADAETVNAVLVSDGDGVSPGKRSR